MLPKRVIPVLLLMNDGLYKTVQFKQPKYVGDPINAVKIFNEKEVDEIVILDIMASKKQEINYPLLQEIATECFMPLTYGGGINNIDQIKKLNAIGVEKVAINTQAVLQPDFIRQAANEFGSSTIVVSMDIKKDLFGKYKLHTQNGTQKSSYEVVTFAQLMEKNGAGEILLHPINRDGTMQGYDLDIIHKIASQVNIPVIACGGAGSFEHFQPALNAGAAAVAAGSMFVYTGIHKAVLINYPDYSKIKTLQ